jgi:hypothetical protein
MKMEKEKIFARIKFEPDTELTPWGSHRYMVSILTTEAEKVDRTPRCQYLSALGITGGIPSVSKLTNETVQGGSVPLVHYQYRALYRWLYGEQTLDRQTEVQRRIRIKNWKDKTILQILVNTAMKAQERADLNASN